MAHVVVESHTVLPVQIFLQPSRAWEWSRYERRGQVKVDLKRFAQAIEDFDLAQKLSPENFISLGLLGNRGLAYEGLSLWPEAVRDYTTAIDLGRSVGAEEPYILNRCRRRTITGGERARANCNARIGNVKNE